MVFTVLSSLLYISKFKEKTSSIDKCFIQLWLMPFLVTTYFMLSELQNFLTCESLGTVYQLTLLWDMQHNLMVSKKTKFGSRHNLIFEVDFDWTAGRTCKVVDASTCHRKRKIGKRKKEKRNRVNALSQC